MLMRTLRRGVAAAVIAAGFVLAGCSSSPTPSSVCADIAAAEANPAVAAQLNALDPHSALGVVWADAKSACVNGQPAAGVNASWTQEVWTLALQLVPTVLPALIGLL